VTEEGARYGSTLPSSYYTCEACGRHVPAERAYASMETLDVYCDPCLREKLKPCEAQSVRRSSYHAPRFPVCVVADIEGKEIAMRQIAFPLLPAFKFRDGLFIIGLLLVIVTSGWAWVSRGKKSLMTYLFFPVLMSPATYARAPGHRRLLVLWVFGIVAMLVAVFMGFQL